MRKHFFVLFLAINLLCLNFVKSSVTDLTYYPEEKPLVIDFIQKSGEYFYKAFYWSDSTTTNLKDWKNGVLVKPFTDCNTSIKAVTYSTSDTVESSIASADSNKRTFLQNTMTAADNSGLFCNINHSQVISGNTQKIKIYMWVINNGAAAAQFKIKGCESVISNPSAACAVEADYTQEVGGGSSIASNAFKVEEVTITVPGAQADTVNVVLNGSTADAKDIYIDLISSPKKLNVQMLLDINPIKLSVAQINIVNTASNNLLKGTGTCTNSEDCLPGLACSTSTCGGQCHPACQLCTDTVTFSYTDDYLKCTACSAISSLSLIGLSSVPGSCGSIDHVDITQLGNSSHTIISDSIGQKYSDAFTMAFWMYIEDITKFGDQVIHIVISNMMSIAIGNDSDKVVAFCNPHILYYPTIATTLSKASFDTISAHARYATNKKVHSAYLNNQWFYVRCAINLTNNYNYVLIDNAKMATPEVAEVTSMKRPYYYDSVEVDYDFRYFGTPTLQIKNAYNLYNADPNRTSVFLKQLSVFTDVIPKTSQLQYYDLQSITANSFPSLWVADISGLSVTGGAAGAQTLSLTFVHYTSGTSSPSSVTVYKNPNATFKIPSNFYRLVLAPPKKYFTTSDMDSGSTGDLSCLASSYCYKNDNQINCPSAKYYDMSTNACVTTCPTNTMPQYGSVTNSNNISTGYCTLPCETAPSTNFQCITSYTGFYANMACTPNTDFTKSHMKCIDNNDLDKGALHYSRYFGSLPTITIPVSPTLQSYYLEVWFYPDKVFTTAGGNSKHYIWLTSGVRVYRGNNYAVTNTFGIEDSAGTSLGSSLTYSFANWYRMAYYVKQIGTNSYQFTYFYNKYGANITASVTNDISLSSIYFCNSTTCGSVSNASWSSAFYRNLRVWDATNIYSTNVFNDFDRYFNNFDSTVPRFTIMKYYYPFTLKYLAEQKINDPDNASAVVSPSGLPSSFNYIKFAPWRYSKAFDKRTTNQYISSFTTVNDLYEPAFSNCPANCKNCNTLECFECDAGYYLVAGACVNNAQQKFYLRSPVYSSGSPADLKFNAITGVTTAFSCSFFVKVLGWITTGSSYDLFRYGSGLKLKYTISAKTLELTNGAGTTTYGTVSNFLAKQGKWINISLSYFYDSTLNSYYPAMMNFQVDFTYVAITGSINAITLNDSIEIPKESVAIYGKIWFWNKYITGAWSEMANAGRTLTVSKKLIDNASITCVADADLNLGGGGSPTKTCVVDYDAILDESTNWCTTAANVAFANSSGCQAVVPTCKYGYYTTSPSNTCGCSSDSTIQDYWIRKNGGQHKCSVNDYVDFDQTTTTSLTGIGTGSTEYTIEFWIYINTYKSGTFNGFEIKWDKQLKIVLDYNSASLRSTCYPFFDSTDSAFEGLNNKAINFSSAQWAYLRCSVSTTLKLFFHFHETLVTSEQTLAGTGPSPIPATTTFILNNLSLNRGLIYFRQLRLWKCYLCQNPDTYKLDITSSTVNFYSNLLHLWDPVFTTGTYPGTVTDLKGAVTITPAIDAGWIGYNIIDESSYTKLVSPTNLCVETLQSCTGIIKFNQIEDTNITVDAALNGRYTIEMWTMVSDVSLLTQGYHVIWRNLVSLSFVKSPTTSTGFNMYCWPQDYRADLQNTMGSTNINNLTTSLLNYDTASVANYASNTWTWVRCAVTHNKNEFYFNSNTVKTLQGDVMWTNQYSDYPMRYLWQNNEKSKFIIKGAGLNSGVDIYIKHVFLFKDYLPKTYDFKHMDLTKINQTNFPALLWSMNTSGYWKQLNKIPYTDKSTMNLSYNPTKLSSVASLSYTWLLVVETMCDPTGTVKYVSQDNCQTITSCVLATLNASFCMDESKPLVCASSYNWDEQSYTLSAATACQQTCTAGFMRSPGSSTTSAVCNLLCDVNSNCPQTAANEIDIYKSNSCNTGYDRYNYKCIDKETSTNKAFLYFNGCLNFPNVSYESFNYGQNSKLQNGYVISFWMKIDRMNEFCSYTGKKKYYFLLEPHSIYLDTTSTTFAQTGAAIPNGYYNMVYQLTTNSKVKGTLLTFSPWNWNFIAIHVNLVSKFLRVYTNYNYFAPDIKFDNLDSATNLTLTKLLFCSVPGSNTNNNLCTSNTDISSNITWGAAFYKNIKIWDGVNANPWVALESELKTFNDNLLINLYDFPFNVRNSLDNKILNLKITGDGLNYFGGTSDVDMLVNYSTKFDYTESNQGSYASTQDLTTGGLTTAACSQYCKRCVSGSTTACTECFTGAKLFTNMCKKYSGYFVKMPLTNYPNKYLSLNLYDVRNNYYLVKENIFTLTIWIKFFGQLQSSTSDCVVIFRLKSDGSVYICYNISDFNLYFYHNKNVLYKDATFNSFLGQWTLISFSSFINKQPNIPLLENYFGYLYRFYVHNQEVPKNANYSISPPGIGFDCLDIGNEFSALFSDLKIYRDFIVNPYGYLFSAQKTAGLVYSLPLMSSISTGQCLTDYNILLENYYGDVPLVSPNTYVSTLGVSCVADYTPYMDSKCGASRWFDIAQIATKDPPCQGCSSTCTGSCAYSLANSNNLGCTCNFNSADNFLKTDKSSSKLYCEGVPQFDFARGTTVVDKIKVASTAEYSLEFWFYIYSYNNTNTPFDSFEVIWDLHNLIKIYSGKGTNVNKLSAHCSPVYNNRNRTAYISEDDQTGYSNYGFDDLYSTSNKTASPESFGTFYKWVYVQCSTSVPRNVFNLNSQPESKLKYDSYLLPNMTNQDSTSLIIQPGSNTKANFGFLFIRELKLWSQYDIRRFTTKCNLSSESLSYFKDTLLHFFTNDYPGKYIYDYLNKTVKGEITKRWDFIGYNLIDFIALEDLKFTLTDECSFINIFPTTGINKSTRFVIQSREIQQALTNSYRFYYKIKDTEEIVELGTTVTIRELDHIFDVDESYFGNQIGNSNNDTVILEVYCDVIFYDPKFITSKQITLYKLLTLHKDMTFISKSGYDTILSTTDLNNGISNEQVLYRTQVLKDLQSDLINATLENFPPLITNSTTIDNSSFYDFIEPTCDTQTNFCNNRGYCYKSSINLFCACNNLYVGDNCQISKNNSASLLNISSQIYDMINYRLTNLDSIENVIDTNLITSIKNLLNVGSKLYKNISEISPLTDIIDKILNLNTAMINKVGLQLSESFTDTVDIISTIFKFYVKNINSQKYDNLASYVTNKNDSGLSNMNEIQYQAIYKDFVVNNKTIRRLQEDASKILILDINNSFKLELTDPQKKEYSDYFEKIKAYFVNLSKGIINANKYGIVDYSYSSEQFDFFIKKIIDKNSFNFKSYFSKRINSFESYFDASECLKNWEYIDIVTNSTNTNTNTNTVFFLYINFKINAKPYENNFYYNSISPIHQIIFFDINSNIINLQCKEGKEILHFMPLVSFYNKDFFSDYTKNPSKYFRENLSLSTGLYYPKFIYPNGSIDNSNTTVQLDWYYTHYNIELRYFDQTNNTYSANGTIFNFIDSQGYIVSSSSHLSDFDVFADIKPNKSFYSNDYFIHYPQILSFGENYVTNMGFYVVILITAFYVITEILLTILNDLKFKFKSSAEIFSAKIKKEFKQIEKDNKKVKDNRYSFYYDTNNEDLNKLDRSFNAEDNIANRNKNELFPLEEEKENENKREEISNENNFDVAPRKLQIHSLHQSEAIDQEDINHVFSRSNNRKLELRDSDQEGNKMNTSERKDQDKFSDNEGEGGSNNNVHLVKIDVKSNKDTSDKFYYNLTSVTDLNSDKKVYNIFYFIFKRNIYANVILFKSAFTPQYKSFSRLFTLIFLLFVIICILLIFLENNLFENVNVDTNKLVGYIFISVFFSNFVLILLTWIITVGRNTRMNILKQIEIERDNIINNNTAEDRQLKKLLRVIKIKNILKTFCINVFNLGLAALLFYLTVGFCAVWSNWAANLLILWAFVLLTDFLVMEVAVELLILMFFALRNKGNWLKKIYKFILALKNLRTFS